MTVAAVNLWGRQIGAVSLDEGEEAAVFQYTPQFAGSGIEVAPLSMPLRPEPYSFPALNPVSFHGLPGLLADSLPDRFGNALIDAWLARQGRSPESFDSVERLCYIGRRGMGALEFQPEQGPRERTSKDISVDALVELASEVLSEREALTGSFAADERADAMRDILLVGTSAGGARAKAVIAWNPATNAVRSGQIDAGPGFEYWLLKFDGVRGNRDKELDDPQGYGAIEYAYSLMAARGRDHDERVPAAGRARPPPLHDPPLRPHPGRRQAAPAVAGRARPLRLQPRRRLRLRAGAAGDPHARARDRRRSSSSSGGWPSTSSRETRTTTSRTSPS